MTTPEEPYVKRLPPEDQREFARHTLGLIQADQQLQRINVLANMETGLLNQHQAGQLGSFFRGNAANCRRSVELWGQMAEHFDAMAEISERHA